MSVIFTYLATNGLRMYLQTGYEKKYRYFIMTHRVLIESCLIKTISYKYNTTKFIYMQNEMKVDWRHRRRVAHDRLWSRTVKDS